MNDNDDIKNSFVRTNMLISPRFHSCSVNVKLLKTFSLCVYDMVLQECFSATTYSKLSVR